MKKILSLIILSTLFLECSYAQPKEDIVYLKNGSILKGKIIENVVNEKTTIAIVGHNIIVIPDSVIKMILIDQKIPEEDFDNLDSPVEMAASVNFYGGR